jgi:ectoine hydroxylase-related dioxygenase (phytanoyl-CoA dioxygenase family)
MPRRAAVRRGRSMPAEIPAVTLTTQQIAEFQDRGFVLLEDRFSAQELALLRRRAELALAGRGERTVMEASGEAVRSVYAPHESDPVFAALARHPRLVRPAQRLLAGDVYVYQSKLNVKSPFVGEVWEWHQDYVFWRNEDAMPSPRVLTAAVYLDDVDDFNGPLVLIPGSHREGVLRCPAPPGGDAATPGWHSHVSARLKYTIDRGVLGGLARKYGLCAPKARAGAVLLFDSNIAHASSTNISPFSRSLILFTYNHVANAPARPTRPGFLVSRDTRAITPVADDVLADPGSPVEAAAAPLEAR